MNYLRILTLLFMASAAIAETAFPPACQPVPVVGETVALKASEQRVLLIHNLSETDLWITHPVTDPSASAGWSSRLEGGNWSALTLDKNSFELSCIESKPGHEQQVACAGMIAICEWASIKIPSQLKGTFWAAENQSLANLKTNLGGRGFKVPVLKQ